MKTFKKIITVICILALALLNITAFADDGYTVDYINNGTKVTVSISDTINEEVDILTNSTLAVKASAKFPATTSTGQTIQQFGSWTKGTVSANNNATAGQIGYYNLPSAKAFQQALTGDIEDYNLVVTFQKGSNSAYIEDIEIGLGNANGISGYHNLATAVRTLPLGDFNYTYATNGTEWTMTLSVRDILDNGNETLFPASGTPNELTGDNINLFAVKAKYRIASTQTASMLKFTSIKLVGNGVGGGSMPSSYSLITAFYDENNQMVSSNFITGTPTSITSDIPDTATYLRSFVWADLNDTLRPIKQDFKTTIPIRRSILFVGGRGAVDSSKKLSALAEAEGYDFNVDCIYYKGRSLQDHWRNTCTDAYDYEIMKNGTILNGTAYYMEKILEENEYDIVVLEQTSGYAGVEDSIFPYLDYLTDFINQKCPSASVYYNTLWPYTSDYTGTIFQFYDNDPEVMKDMINSTAQYIDSRTDVEIINTNDIVYNLANVDALSLYQQESDTIFYRLNDLGQAAVQSQILYSLSGTAPKATSITSVYSSVTAANANKIIGYLE